MQVKVWNDNVHEFKSRFKGDDITIPAKGFVEMEYYDAHEFRGQYHPIFRDASGLQAPESFKIIRIEKIDAEPVLTLSATPFSCMKCSKSYESSPVLEAHIKTAHAEDVRTEIPEIDQSIAAKKSKKQAASA